MAGNTRSRIRLRSTTYKCDVCNRQYLSTAALKTHQVCVHGISRPLNTKVIVTRSRHVKRQFRNRQKTSKSAVKKKTPLAMSIKKDSVTDIIQPEEPKLDSDEEIPDKVQGNTTQTVFECPKCKTIYPVYFLAFKHIQKNHCVNNKGEEVSPFSPDLIRPKRVERCTKCLKTIIPSKSHTCIGNSKTPKGKMIHATRKPHLKSKKLHTQEIDTSIQEKVIIDNTSEANSATELESDNIGSTLEASDTESCTVPEEGASTEFLEPIEVVSADNISCAACNQIFPNASSFDIHVSCYHHDDKIDCLFFPNNEEFISWKEDMEKRTKCKYTIMHTVAAKPVYQCAHNFNTRNQSDTTDQSETNVVLCPSSIVTKKFSKGIQIKFYKVHSKHLHFVYTLPEQYEKYSVPNLMGKTTFEKKNDKDLYIQFQLLMRRVVQDAAKVNIHTLRVLIYKALEMSTIIVNYKEDDDLCEEETSKIPTESLKAMTDKQITKALEAMCGSEQSKSEKSTDTKKIGILKSRLLFGKEPPCEAQMPKVPIPALKQEPMKRNISTPIQQVSPAKRVCRKSVHFITKESEDSKEVVQEPEIKTKSPPNLRQYVNKNKKAEPIGSNSDNSVTNDHSLLQSPSSFNDSYKDFVDKTLKISLEKKGTKKDKPEEEKKPAKKTVLKTKIGQFVPSVSPVKITPNRSLLKSQKGLGSVKIDKYEVREQKNDCNILVLKI